MWLQCFLHRDRIAAPPGYNRWLVPPAALAIHLSVGQAYAFSVFNIPLTKLLGISHSDARDWSLTTVTWVFSLAIVFLGLSAALFGKWLEAAGPRKAMFASACCFGSGFLIASIGVRLHQFWLLLLGYGVVGGIGLGLGYISPVSTLIKWFPDRPGMATGMAIMGFGGGAMIGSPLGANLMKQFTAPNSTGVEQTFLVMGVLYFSAMMFGVLTIRLPAQGWVPNGYQMKGSAIGDYVPADRAIKTRSFWLLWLVLFINVSAGIGVLSQASPMIQEMFPGAVGASAAAGFVGLLSLFNLAGRFAWSSLSDKLGRKPVYAIFFLLGSFLYAAVPGTSSSGRVAVFVTCFALIMSMYGGGFATIPAYLKDLFGTQQVGAIHGRLLTAWSLAGIAGPLLVSSLHDSRIAQGISGRESHSLTLWIIAGAMLVGLACNLMVRPVDQSLFESPTSTSNVDQASRGTDTAHSTKAAFGLVGAWSAVLIPLGWGITQTVEKAMGLFR